MECNHKVKHTKLADNEIEAKIIEVLKHTDEKLRAIFENFKANDICAGDFLTVVANVLARMSSMYLYHCTHGRQTDDAIHHLMDLLKIISQYNGLDMQVHTEIQEDGSTKPVGMLH
jgi:hypothetical protein